MKTKLPKILGAVLTLVLLVSLLAFAVPASAGSLTWSGVSIPLVATNQLFEADGDPGPVALSPNFANDNTMFAGVNDILNAGDAVSKPVVYRSLDGGYTWTATSTALGAAAGDVIVDLEVSPNYANDSTIFVATQTPAGGAGTGIVYRSTNGGSTFSQLGVVTLAAGEVITSMSVSPNYDGVGIIAVGIAITATATAATAASNVQLWGANAVLNWTAAGTGAAEDVAAVQYSPNYPIDATLLVVTSPVAAGVLLKDNVGGVWGIISAAGVAVTGVITDFDGRTLAAVTDLQYADIALPSDYNGTTPTLRRAYISLVAENGYVAGGNGSNVYRVDNVTAGIASNPAVELGDIDYSGTYAAGTLMGGLVTKAAAALNVYYTATAMTTAPIWYPATNGPSGTSIAAILPGAAATVLSVYLSGAHIDMAADFSTSTMVAVGTVGTDSAVGISLNAGVNYNERGLIDNAGAALAFPTAGAAPNIFGASVALSPDFANDQTMFMTSDNSSGGANDTNVLRTMDAGAHWDRVMTANFATGGVGVIAVSQGYGTDSTVYVGDTTTVNIFYSNSKGEGWSARTIAAAIGVSVGAMVATDATTLYVADDGGGNVAKSLNSGWVWSGANSKATGSTANLRSIAVEDSTVVVGDSTGTVYRSADGGVTWARVGTQILAGQQTYVDVQGDHVYAQLGATGDLYRWDVGTSTAWYQMTATPALGRGIVVADDGTLYALDSTAAANTSVYRSIDSHKGPAAPVPFFEWMQGLAGVLSRDIAVAAGSSNTVVVMEGTNNALWIYTDLLSEGSAGPTLVGPEDGYAMLNTDQAVYQIENVTGITNWQLIFSNDSSFINGVDVTNNQVPPATQVFVDISADTAGVSNEVPIYWMARATAPLRGPWSESRTVIAQPQIAPNAPVLSNPAGITAADVSITPIFSWTAFKNATGYQLQVAKAGSAVNFTEANMVVDEVLGPVTTYYLSTPLDYSAAYGWRVRALTASGESDWSGAVGFMTEAEATPTQPPVTFPPQPTPTFTVTVPPATVPPATPITPSWIYAIIVVGAVLVIAVVVLIIRTRRVS